MHYLGLEQALGAHAFLPQGSQFRHWRNGRVITESPLGDAVAERYGAPYYHMHRGDLLSVLLAAAESHPHIELRTQSPVERISADQPKGGVRVEVGERDEVAACLIGADGIHSRVRQSLWGDQQPTFTGNVAWRMLVPTSKLPEGMVRPMSTVHARTRPALREARGRRRL